MFNNDALARYELMLARGYFPHAETCELNNLVYRFKAAEDVIIDAEKNVGVVNPLLVNIWRESAGMPETML
jgi:hypothetical protein